LVIGKEKPFITMLGIGDPVVVWDDTKSIAGNRTFDSATFGVGGDFFMAINMTFQVSVGKGHHFQ
jgi:pectinesterase